MVRLLIIFGLLLVNTNIYPQSIATVVGGEDSLLVKSPQVFEFKGSLYFYMETTLYDELGIFKVDKQDTVPTKFIDYNFPHRNNRIFYKHHNRNKFIFNGDDFNMFMSNGNVGNKNVHSDNMVDSSFPYKNYQLGIKEYPWNDYNGLAILGDRSGLPWYESLQDYETLAAVSANKIIKYKGRLVIAGRDYFSVKDSLAQFRIKDISELEIDFYNGLTQEIIYEGKPDTKYKLDYFFHNKPYYLLVEKNGPQKVLKGFNAPLNDVTEQFDVDGRIISIDNIPEVTDENSERYLLMKYRKTGEEENSFALLDGLNDFVRTELEPLTGYKRLRPFIEIENSSISRLFVQPLEDLNTHLLVINWKNGELIDSFITPGIESHMDYQIEANNNKIYFAKKHPEKEELKAARYELDKNKTRFLKEDEQYITDPVEFDFLDSTVFVKANEDLYFLNYYLWRYRPDGVTSTRIPEERIEPDLNITPNPFNDQVTVSVSENLPSPDCTISIVNTQGRLFYKQTLETQHAQKITINSEGWQPGLYLLNIQSTEGHIFTAHKMIKH